MGRCHLKGALGDKLHAVLCAAGFNIRWLLRGIARKGLRALLCALRAKAATAVRGGYRLTSDRNFAPFRLDHPRVYPAVSPVMA